MISALEIKQKLSLVSMGKLSVNAFEDWLIPRSWNVHKSDSPEAIDLVSSIHLLFSERDDHILKIADLNNELTNLLRGVRYLNLVERPRPEKFEFFVRASAPVIQVSLVV
jgi:hypothetical protein